MQKDALFVYDQVMISCCSFQSYDDGGIANDNCQRSLHMTTWWMSIRYPSFRAFLLLFSRDLSPVRQSQPHSELRNQTTSLTTLLHDCRTGTFRGGGFGRDLAIKQPLGQLQLYL